MKKPYIKVQTNPDIWYPLSQFTSEEQKKWEHLVEWFL